MYDDQPADLVNKQVAAGPISPPVAQTGLITPNLPSESLNPVEALRSENGPGNSSLPVNTPVAATSSYNRYPWAPEPSKPQPAGPPPALSRTVSRKKLALGLAALTGILVLAVIVYLLLRATQPTFTSYNPETNTLSVNANTVISDGKKLTADGQVLIQNESNSTKALVVQDAAGNNLLVADTLNSKIGINTTPSATGADLQVDGTIGSTGDINSGANIVAAGSLQADDGTTKLSDSGLVINSALVCTSNGCKAAEGVPGPRGDNGANGAAGAKGTNGINGANGKNGENGVNGADGSGCSSGACVQLQASSPGTPDNGNLNISGTAVAGSFQGNGSGLSNVNATTLNGNNSSFFTNGSNISTGTINNSRLDPSVTLQGNTFNGASQLVQLNPSGDLPAVSGINLTNLNANNIAAGTLNDLRLSPNVTLQGNTFNGASQLLQATAMDLFPALNGSLITNLNASNVATGTLSDGRLSANVALLNANQTFSGNNTFGNTLVAPSLQSAGASLNIGTATASLNLQGSLASSFGAVSGANSVAIGFSGVPTGNIAYQFDVATTPGTYTVCTTVGNCAGSGTGATTLGGDTNRVAKFTGTNSIGDSSISDNGISIVVQPGSDSATTFQVQNAAGNSNLLVADTTDTRIAIAKATADYTLDVNGTVNGTILRQNGNQVCDVSGNCTGGSGQIGGSGTIGTIPVFTASSTVGDSTLSQSGSTVTGTNINVTGQYQVGGSPIASSNLSDSANLAKLNGTGPQIFTGDNKFSGAFLAQDATNSATAFQIQNAAGTGNLLIADTVNGRIGVGVLPAYTLDVGGDINISSGSVYRINGVAICGPTPTCAPSVGSGNYIQNGVAQQSSANFNIRSVSAGSVVGVLRGAVGQSADLLRAQDENGANVFSIGSTGNTLVQASTNSTTAFQIQNAGNQSLFVADTSHQQIAIGPAAIPANSVLTVGANTTAASGGVYFGTDTNLYRSASNTLKTDGSLQVAANLGVGYSPGSITGGVAAFNGSVGIGTNAPTQLLQLTASGDTAIRFQTQNVVGGGTQTNTSATSPGTMADDATVGTVAWTNPGNAQVNDNVYATAAGKNVISHYIKATNFGFSIPAGATINGILAEVERKGTAQDTAVFDSAVRIVKSSGAIGTTNEADTLPAWPMLEAYKSYGSSADLWGEAWAPSDINNSNFGLAVSASLGPSSGLNETGFIDHIRITVYYTPPGEVNWTAGGDQSDSGKFKISSSTSLGTNDNLTLNNNGSAVFKNTTNSTTAFQIQNATGTSLLTVDTQNSQIITANILPNATPIITPGSYAPSPTTNNIDTSGKTDTAIMGSDGFPRIFETYNSGGASKFLQCTNVTCTTYNSSTVTSTVWGFYGSAIALAPDGTARILYVAQDTNGGDDILHFIQCANVACSSSTLTTVDQGAFGQSTYVAMYMGSDGYARYAYSLNIGGVGGYSLIYVQCTNDACSTKNTTTVDSSLNSTQSISLYKGNDGYPRIAYSVGASPYRLKFAQCTNDACTSPTISTVSNTSIYSSAVIGSDGYARVAYEDASSNVYYLQCTNASCSTSTNVTVASADATAFGHINLMMGSDGYPRIAYRNTSAGLKYVQCSNSSCSSSTTIVADGSTNAGLYPNMVMGPDNIVRIVNVNTGVRMASISIVPTTATVSGGANIGSVSNLFANVYASQIQANYFNLTPPSDAYNVFQVNSSSSTSVLQVDSATNGGQVLVRVNGNSPASGQRLCSNLTDGTTGLSAIYDCGGGQGDYAEDYGTTDASITAGDLVALDPDKPATTYTKDNLIGSKAWVLKASTSSQATLIGVVSTMPNETIGENFTYDENPRPIALSGRVPVNVDTENGSISPGDYLTSSSTPGYAMKATKPGVVVGRALAAFDGTSGTVLVLVGTQYYDPVSDELQGGTLDATNISLSGNLTVSGTAAFQGDITIQGHIIGNGDTSGVVTLASGSSTITYSFSKAYAIAPKVVITPESDIGNLHYWITKTTTTFTVNLSGAAPSDLKFDYFVQQ